MAEKDIIQQFTEFVDTLNNGLDQISEDISNYLDINDMLSSFFNVSESMKGFFDNFTKPFMDIWNKMNAMRQAGEQIDIAPIRSMEESLKEMLTFKNIFSRRLSPRSYFNLEIPDKIDNEIKTYMSSFNELFSSSSGALKQFRNVFTSLQELTLPREDYGDIISSIREGLTSPDKILQGYEKLKENIKNRTEQLYNESVEAETRGDTFWAHELNQQLEMITNLMENMDKEFNKKMKTYTNAYNIVSNILDRVGQGATPLEAMESEYNRIAREISMEGARSRLEKNLRIFERFNVFDFENIDIGEIPTDLLQEIQNRVTQLLGKDLKPDQLERYTKLYYKFLNEYQQAIDKTLSEMNQQMEKNIYAQNIREIYQVEVGAGGRPYETFINVRDRVRGEFPEESIRQVESEVVQNIAQRFADISQNIDEYLRNFGFVTKIGRRRFPNLRYLPQISGLLDVDRMSQELSEVNMRYAGLLNDISNTFKETIQRRFEENLSQKYAEYNNIRSEILPQISNMLQEDVSQLRLSEIIERLGSRFYELPSRLQMQLNIGEELEQSLISNITSFEFFKQDIPSPEVLFQEMVGNTDKFIKQLNNFAKTLTYRSGYKIMPIGDIGFDMGMVPQPDFDVSFRRFSNIMNIFRRGLSPQFLQLMSERLTRLTHILSFDQQRVDMLENINNLRRLYQAYDQTLERFTGKDSQEFLRNLYNQLTQQLEEPFKKELPTKLEAPEDFQKFRDFLTKYGLPQVEGIDPNTIRETIRETINNFNKLAESLRTGRVPLTDQFQIFFRDFSSSMAMFTRFMGQMGGWVMGMPAMSSLWMVSYQPTMAAMQVTQPLMWGLGGLTGGTLFYQELMGFLYQLPQRLIQVQEQFITMSTLMGSRTLGARALEQAMEIARWQPIQFEEATQTITAFTIFPETRQAIKQPEFQRQALETVQLLQMLVPEQGVEGAIFAIRELLGNQFRSIERRFNISRELLSSFAEVSVEEFKDLPGPEKIRALHRALSQMFAGGEEILLQRGLMFDVQIRNFTDTLIRTLFPPLTMKPQETILQQLQRMFVGPGGIIQTQFLRNVLGESVWERYESLARTYTAERTVTPRVEQIAFELYLSQAGTVSGLLSTMFAGINNLFSNMIGRTDIGGALSRQLLYVLQPFVGGGGFIERWSQLSTTSGPNVTLSNFIEDFITSTDQSIQRFREIINRDDIRQIFDHLAMTIMDAMMTSMEMPMKIATIGGLKLTTQLPRIMGETLVDATIDMFSGGRKLFNITDILGTMFTIHGFTSFMRPDVSTLQAFSRLGVGLAIPMIPELFRNIPDTFNDIMSGFKSFIATGEFTLQRPQQTYESLLISGMLLSPFIQPLIGRIGDVLSKQFSGLTFSRLFTSTGSIIFERNLELLGARTLFGIPLRNIGLGAVGSILAVDALRELNNSASTASSALRLLGDSLTFLSLIKKTPALGYLGGALGVGSLALRFAQEYTGEGVTDYSPYITGIGGVLTSIGSGLLLGGVSAPIGIGLMAVGSIMTGFGKQINNFIQQLQGNIKDETNEALRQSFEANTLSYDITAHRQQIMIRNQFSSFFKKYGININELLKGSIEGDQLELFGAMGIKNIPDINRWKQEYNKELSIGLTNMFSDLQVDPVLQQKIRKSTDLSKLYKEALSDYQEDQHRLTPTILELARRLGIAQRYNIIPENEYLMERMGGFISEAYTTPRTMVERAIVRNPQLRDVMERMSRSGELDSLRDQLTDLTMLRARLVKEGLGLDIFNKITNEIKSGKLTSENVDNYINDIGGLSNTMKDNLKSYIQGILRIKNIIEKYSKEPNVDFSQLMLSFSGINVEPLIESVNNILQRLSSGEFLGNIFSQFYLETIKPPELPSPMQFLQGPREFEEQLRQYYSQLQEWFRPAQSLAQPQSFGNLMAIAGLAQSAGVPNAVQRAQETWYQFMAGMMKHPEMVFSNPLDVIMNFQRYLPMITMGRMAIERLEGPEAANMWYRKNLEYLFEQVMRVPQVLNPEERRSPSEIIQMTSANITIGNATISTGTVNIH